MTCHVQENMKSLNMSLKGKLERTQFDGQGKNSFCLLDPCQLWTTGQCLGQCEQKPQGILGCFIEEERGPKALRFVQAKMNTALAETPSLASKEQVVALKCI